MKNLDDQIEFLQTRLEHQSDMEDHYEQLIVNLKCELETTKLKFENEFLGLKKLVKLGRDLQLKLQGEIYSKEKEVTELKRLLEVKTSKVLQLTEELTKINAQLNGRVNSCDRTRVKDLEKIIETLKFELGMKDQSETFLRTCKKDLEMHIAGLEKKLLDAEVMANILKTDMNSAADSVKIIAKDLSVQVLALMEEKEHLLGSLETDETRKEAQVLHKGFLSEIDSFIRNAKVIYVVVMG